MKIYERRDRIRDALIGLAGGEMGMAIVALSRPDDGSTLHVTYPASEIVETVMLAVAQMTPEMLDVVRAWRAEITCHKLESGCYRGSDGIFCIGCTIERKVLGIHDEEPKAVSRLTNTEDRIRKAMMGASRL